MGLGTVVFGFCLFVFVVAITAVLEHNRCTKINNRKYMEDTIGHYSSIIVTRTKSRKINNRRMAK